MHSCYCGPLQKQSTYTLQLLLGALWKQSICTIQLLLGAPLKAARSAKLWCASENIIWVDNKFFTKNEENLFAKLLQGGPRQVPCSPPLKHTTVCDPPYRKSRHESEWMKKETCIVWFSMWWCPLSLALKMLLVVFSWHVKACRVKCSLFCVIFRSCIEGHFLYSTRGIRPQQNLYSDGCYPSAVIQLTSPQRQKVSIKSHA